MVELREAVTFAGAVVVPILVDKAFWQAECPVREEEFGHRIEADY